MAEPTPTIAIPPIIDDNSASAVRVTARRLRDDLVVVTVNAEIDLYNMPCWRRSWPATNRSRG